MIEFLTELWCGMFHAQYRRYFTTGFCVWGYTHCSKCHKIYSDNF